MITKEQLIDWAERNYWVEELNFELSIDRCMGQTLATTDGPWHVICLRHTSGITSYMRVHKHEHMSEVELFTILTKLIQDIITKIKRKCGLHN